MIDQHDLDRLIAYAEGELSPEQRLALEAELRDRPDLARALDQIRADAHALRRHYTFPVEAPHRAPVTRYAAVAAVLVVAAVVAFFAWPTPVRTVQLGHARGVMEGPFEPDVVCDTPEKFRQYGIDTFGVPLTADFEQAAASNVALIGWTSYEGRYGRDVESGENPLRVLLARAPDGGRVVVVFRPPGTLRFDDGYTHGFTRHSTTLGGLIVDEIGTNDQPVVLPLLGVEGE